MSIEKLLEGPQVTTCDETVEIAGNLANFIHEIITKRGIQAALAIHLVRTLYEVSLVDFLRQRPLRPITIRMIHAARNLLDEVKSEN